jgi:uncharacterized protein YbjT (DUF2867 family)
VQGDALDPQSLAVVMHGVDTVYFLIHSLGSGTDFTERDTTAARNCAAAARHARVKRIIYLGGLGDPRADLSHHLRSRQCAGLPDGSKLAAGRIDASNYWPGPEQ